MALPTAMAVLLLGCGGVDRTLSADEAASAPAHTLGPSPTDPRAPRVISLQRMASGETPEPPPSEAVVRDGDGRPIGRLSLGDTEWLRRIAPPADEALGIGGVDLGIAFSSHGRTSFLFGDAWAAPDFADRDPVGTLPPSAAPDDAQIRWNRSTEGTFQPIGFSDAIETGTFAVPTDGVTLAGTTYVFYASDFDEATRRHGTAVLAHASRPGEFDALDVDHAAPSERFVNVSAVADGDDVWLFGSGPYRQSDVYLARATAGSIGDRSAWEFLVGMHGSEATFGTGEGDAKPIVEGRCVGELSVRRDPSSGLFLMAYNCSEPRGILLRVAHAPEGPWSDPIVVFEPERDGYGVFMHRAVCDGSGDEACVDDDDGLADPGREHEWGGEYGAYLIEPWIEYDAGLLTIVYTLSSWNPYAVHLVRSTLLWHEDGHATAWERD